MHNFLGTPITTHEISLAVVGEQSSSKKTGNFAGAPDKTTPGNCA
jgi:hypothetical protein